LQQIEPDLVARGAAGRVGLDIMPVREVNAGEVRWSQQDNFYGLQALRGLDGAPTRVQRVGAKTYSYEPGVFGEFVDITETELTRRAGYSPTGDGDRRVRHGGGRRPAAHQSRVRPDRSDHLVLLTTGTFSIKLDGPTGIQVGFSDTFAIQTFTAGVTWATSRNGDADPQLPGRAAARHGRGHSVDLGAGAIVYMNSVTSNRMLNNANAADLAGRRITAGNTPNNLGDVNRYYAAQNLPQVQVYDGGYQTVPTVGATVGPFVKFIPDGKAVVSASARAARGWANTSRRATRATACGPAATPTPSTGRTASTARSGRPPTSSGIAGTMAARHVLPVGVVVMNV
jgi:hypothetical protein